MKRIGTASNWAPQNVLAVANELILFKVNQGRIVFAPAHMLVLLIDDRDCIVFVLASEQLLLVVL